MNCKIFGIPAIESGPQRRQAAAAGPAPRAADHVGHVRRRGAGPAVRDLGRHGPRPAAEAALWRHLPGHGARG